MSRALRVSPRHLGQLCLKNFCPRCYWYQVQMNFKLPFDRPMPGILYNLDIFEKLLVSAHFSATGKAPAWLSPLRCAREVDFPEKMTQEFPDLNITMVGKPDAVFKNPGGKLVLVDYKTARYKGDDDPFMPAYETQLLGYASLLAANGIGDVVSAALVYFHNTAKEHNDDPMELFTKEGMAIPFEVKIHEVALNKADLRPLLETIREYADLKDPPKGLLKCKDCGRLGELLKSEEDLRNLHDYFSRRDAYFRKVFQPALEANQELARRAGLGLEREDGWLLMDDVEDSRPAAWDL